MRRMDVGIGLFLLVASVGCGSTPSRRGGGRGDGGAPGGAMCGDGRLAAGESCDDGNDVAGDGCDACATEAGYACQGEPSVCEMGPPMACGDGTRGPGEECDDGNNVAGDGCSASCRMEGCPDADGDSFTDRSCGGLDCDDADPRSNPDAPEICGNAVDENCDGTVLPIVDEDHDGSFCTLDCDDADPMVAPSQPEICGNGVDDDCNPSTPDLFDGDMDGVRCDMDCDDSSASARPGAVEVCGNGVDDDCDPSTPDIFDADMDGVSCDVDCDDSDTSVGATAGGCSFRYFEDFEAGDGGWVAGGTASSWAYGTPAATFIPAAASGAKAWVTNLTGDYNADEDSTLTSPPLDMSATREDPILRFSLIHNTESCCDEGWVELSLDGGAVWTRVEPSTVSVGWFPSGRYWNGDSGAVGQWQQVQSTLVGAAGVANVRVRVVFSSDFSGQREGFGIDDVLIVAPYANLAATAVMGPASGCSLSAGETLALDVQNVGTSAVDTFDVSYSLDGAAAVTESVTHRLAPGDTYTHTFASTLDLSVPGNHRIDASVALAGDADAADDHSTLLVHHAPTLVGLASVDFEDDGGFTVEGTNATWAWGVPAGAFISGAASGSNAWVTNLSGDYNVSERSYLVSPCFDLSAITTDPILTFSHIFDTGSSDEGWVEFSFDDGGSWTKLGGSGEGRNWYNDSSNDWWDRDSGVAGEWRLAYHTLRGSAGMSSVRVRFVLNTDSSGVNEGMGVDDFALVREVVDAAVTSVATSTGCGLGAAESLRVVVQNNGSVSLASIPVDVQIDSAAPVREIVPGPIAPGATAAYTLMTTADLSGRGGHVVRVAAIIAGDVSPGNDAAELTRPATLSLPFSTDFEADDASFTVSGTSASWAWGVPVGTLVSSAVSGTRAWVTNLSGDYNNNETSYLTTPCFDASASPSLFLRFKHIMELESVDEGWVEVSTDGGSTWSKLGAAGDGSSWYNDTTNDWWDGSTPTLSGDPWHDAFIDVSAYAGTSALRFRFVLRTDRSVRKEGFGIDDLSVAP